VNVLPAVHGLGRAYAAKARSIAGSSWCTAWGSHRITARSRSSRSAPTR
jgi:hypothetical protein